MIYQFIHSFYKFYVKFLVSFRNGLKFDLELTKKGEKKRPKSYPKMIFLSIFSYLSSLDSSVYIFKNINFCFILCWISFGLKDSFFFKVQKARGANDLIRSHFFIKLSSSSFFEVTEMWGDLSTKIKDHQGSFCVRTS